MRNTRHLLFSLLLIAALSGCGQTSPGSRAVMGVGIGTVAGTAAAIVIDGNPVTGALIGATVGGLSGALTKEGDSVWE